ncbi:MAG: dihydroorotase [Phycisphaerae bacterium]|nr:MAG: dihydroorotase [Phycisphaerae bacterium]
MGSLLIRNGRVIDPASELDQVLDVAIADDQVAAIGRRLPRADAEVVINAEGCLVTPGLIDPHVHLREPGGEHKETLHTGSLAAVAGGFTTVCCMPNTTPALDAPDALTNVLDRAARTAVCRVFPVAAATKARRGDEITEIELLARHGAVGFSDDGDCIASAGMMARVLTTVQRTGLAFMQHCQEPTLTRGAAMHAGDVATRLGLGGWPRVAEEIIIERDLRLNASIACRYHVQHISSGGSVDLVRRARAAGQRITAEASPHHLLLTHDACDGYNTAAKVNPPLREASDVAALRQAVVDGVITILATDHAPHSQDEKALPFEEAPFGLVGLETAVALYAEALVHSGAITWPRLIALLTLEPARLCNLDAVGLGALAVGGPADVTILDPALRWTIAEHDLRGRSRNTPFLGRRTVGKPLITIVAGRLAHGADTDRIVRRRGAPTSRRHIAP